MVIESLEGFDDSIFLPAFFVGVILSPELSIKEPNHQIWL